MVEETAGIKYLMLPCEVNEIIGTLRFYYITDDALTMLFEDNDGKMHTYLVEGLDIKMLYE